MKYILYMLLLGVCIAGCKKQEEKKDVRFTKLQFVSKSDIQFGIKYDGKMYTELAFPIVVTYGDNKFELYKKSTGEKFLDTTINVTGRETYYILQSDTSKKPKLIKDPIVNEPAALPGYMKIKIANEAQLILPYQKIDVVIYSVTDYESIPIDTLKGISSDYSKDYFLVKRDILKSGNQERPQIEYEFGFINSVTGRRIMASGGDPFVSGYYQLTVKPFNVFMLRFQEEINLYPDFNYAFMEKNGKYYSIRTEELFSK